MAHIPRLAVGVITQCNSEPCRSEILAARETWAREADELNIPVTFFCPEAAPGYDFVCSLSDIPSGPCSSLEHYWKALRHLQDQGPSDYFLMIPSSTYPHLPRILSILKKYDENNPILIGGPLGTATLDFQFSFPYFHAGHIYSKAAAELLTPHASALPGYWENLCSSTEGRKFSREAEICAGRAAFNLGVTLISEPFFHACDWMGERVSAIPPAAFQHLPNLATCGGMSVDALRAIHLHRDSLSQYLPLHSAYEQAFEGESDLSDLLELIYDCAKESRRALICGRSSDEAVVAIIKGIVDGGASLPTRGHITWLQGEGELVSIGENNGADIVVVPGETLEYGKLEEYDILFVDSLRVYGQLMRELKRFAPSISKRVIITGTTLDATLGETLRTGSNMESLMKKTGYKREEIRAGLWPAIIDFLADQEGDSPWILEKRYYNGAGMTILERDYGDIGYNIYLWPGNCVYQVFSEVARGIKYALEASGKRARISDLLGQKGYRDIILGVNTAPYTVWQAPSDNYIVVNFEQLFEGSSWIAPQYMELLRTHEVWEYSTGNLPFYLSQGLPRPKMLRYGWTPVFDEPKEFPLDPTIDVLFIGSRFGRRTSILSQIREQLEKDRPSILFREESRVWGEERDKLLRSARILLNIHGFDNNSRFEIVRVAHAASNGPMIISEPSEDIDEEWSKVVSLCPAEEMAERVLYYLDHEEDRLSMAAESQRLSWERKFIVPV